jgi:hypothetical protein
MKAKLDSIQPVGRNKQKRIAPLRCGNVRRRYRIGFPGRIT